MSRVWSILRGKWIRRICRWLALAMSVGLIWFAWPWKSAGAWVVGASPFIALSGAITAGKVGVVALAGLPVLMLMLLSRRWFCRYACGLGLMQDGCQLGRRKRATAWRRWPGLGQMAFVATLAGACVGMPLFLWADPMAMLGGMGALWAWPVGWAAALGGILGLGVLLMAFIAPHLWCARLCPLGGMQEMLNDAVRWVIGWRKGRGAGREMALDQAGPPQEQPTAARGYQWSRRVILGAGFGVASALAIKARGGASTVLRPPGAVPAGQFEWLCVRCGNCVRACPYTLLHADLGRGGAAGVLAPVITFDNDYCRADCVRCGQVCPSGAIARITTAQKKYTRLGLARVNMDTCDMAKNGDCRRCIQECPYLAIEPAGGEFDPFPKVLQELCTGCGACQRVCPIKPVSAIVVS